MNKAHRFGKDLQRIIGYAKDDDAKIFKPKLFCKTRWIAYSFDAMKSTHNNYKYMYRSLTEKRDDMVDKIGNSTFVVDMSLLTDIYSQQSQFSKSLQTTDLFDWHVRKAINLCNRELEVMANALKDQSLGTEELAKINFNGGPSLLKYTSSVMKELKEKGEFHGQPITIRQHRPMSHGTREATQSRTSNETEFDSVFAHSRRKAAEYIENLLQKITIRFEGQMDPENEQGLKRKDISESMCVLFDMESILTRDPSEVPAEALKYYSTGAKAAGFLESTSTLARLSEQYKLFQECIHTHAKRAYENAQGSLEKRNEEKKFYTQLMNGHFNAKTFMDINQILLTGMLRLSNESQCESFASMIKRIHDNRGALGLKKLSMETFIAKNGPSTSIQADPLLKLSLKRELGEVKDWHFIPKPKKNSLNFPSSSKVIDDINKKEGIISFL